jgi:class 3 adenylate cyclase
VKLRWKAFGHWSIRYKLLLLLVTLGVATFAATGTIAYLKYLQALKQNVMNQLTGVNRGKAHQLESYYQMIHNHVLTLSEDRMFIQAVREFGAAYRKLNAAAIPPEALEAATEDIRARFYPEMQKMKMARPHVEDYMLVTPAAYHLQYAYITKTPRPPGSGRDIENPGDGSDYSAAHARYHRLFRRIIEKFGYEDLLLIDYESARVLYTVDKERDFATSLRQGPYRDTQLAKIVQQAVSTNNPDDVFFTDFAPYEPSFGRANQFAATPIFDGEERIGVLAFRLSTDAIDAVVSGNRGWRKDGLGESGQSVIIGADYRLRSNIRPYMEDPAGFLAQLKAAGVAEDRLNRVRLHKSTFLEFAAKYPSATAGLAGKEGSTIERRLLTLGSSLVSYKPLQIPGVHWVMESRMNLEEALKPVSELERLFGQWGAGLLVLTVAAALLMTRQIERPVKALVGAAEKVAAGDLTATVQWKYKDELGVLSDTFNAMTKSIREKTELIEQKNRENEALLLNILPGEIAARLKEGEGTIADSFAELTVLFGDIVGFTVLSSHTPANEIVDMLNGLFIRFDQAARELGIEKIKTIGDCYMAVCGLPKTCPDHAERMARMALRMTEATRQYAGERGQNLQLRIGLNSGPVVAGVIGAIKFIYDLWGDTVNLASRMESSGVPGRIQVTRSVYDQLKDKFEFESRGVIQVKGKGEIETWLLHGELRPGEVSA